MKPQAFALLPPLADLQRGSIVPGSSIGRSTRPSLRQRIAAWRRVARERRRLRELDPRLLQDIGLTAAEANYEASRPFWDLGGSR
jgi:uncharacterized protein YjiS (DUF1127 family)